jgi:adenosyl cobinamide kinase/adenosyl cobinamide phosphate guanylyltransferase
MARPLVLVLGGTRSGKSTYGLARVRELAGGQPVAYLATALTALGRPELEDRIDRHRRARPADWRTSWSGRTCPGRSRRRQGPVLLDGLTLWLSAVAGDDLADIDAVLEGPVAAALEAIDRHPAPSVVVSDEIGLGMVPMDPGARAFRDLQGLVHQRLAAAADEVHLMVAGLPLTLKPRS